MAKTDFAERVVVCDAGPIIHLDEVGCLELLADFTEVLVPNAVWKEVERHRPSALSSPVVALSRTAPDLNLTSELQATARLFALHVGEIQALQLATLKRTDLLLTDDTAARLAARNLSIPVHGTIGILLRSIRRKQRSVIEVIEILRLLPTLSTLHIKQSLLDEILLDLEKE
ncbi:MAG: hypothetical protein SH868_10595 [Bythopirellula sp.]|nr:hypothetical protein [Bythopirellula sp.]